LKINDGLPTAAIVAWLAVRKEQSGMAEAMDVDAAVLTAAQEQKTQQQTEQQTSETHEVVAPEQELPFSEDELAVCYKVNDHW
jgi:hypothetical protein